MDRKSNFKEYSQPVLVSGDFKPEDIDNILSQENVQGICLKGGDELRPGQKDFDELADILEYLEA